VIPTYSIIADDPEADRLINVLEPHGDGAVPPLSLVGVRDPDGGIVEIT